MPEVVLTNVSGGLLNPLVGIELAFTKMNLIDEIKKDAFPGNGQLRRNISLYVARWLEAILSAPKLTSTNARPRKVVEIIALDHQHPLVSPYNKVFDWRIIGYYTDSDNIYGKTAGSKDSLQTVEWKVDPALQTPNDETAVQGDYVGRIRIVYKSDDVVLPTWHWDITLDHGCFEIQTCPTLVSHYNAFAFNVLEKHVMGCAKKSGLDDNSGMGGAQFNIDFATGLAGDYLMILHAIASTERSRAEFRKLKRKDNQRTLALTDNTAFNAAYIKENGRPTELAQNLGALMSQFTGAQKYYNGAWTHASWINDFFAPYRFLMRKYPTDQHLVQFVGGKARRFDVVKLIKAQDVNDAPYNEEIERFQALNITNIQNTTPTLRRVEFRDFFAIYDIDDLATAMSYAYNVLVEAHGRNQTREEEDLRT